ncbi:DNA gyrase inhibitor YacG [Avibacterium endocarditidis]|uniref:DNA gyrase inhibitor YacG n=1 Tax=Avibacterium endocarditidis TaxID=380674 RepID=A0ABX4ZRR7_9PAST|nr:DNA gyrase inhibitor YacG [Avibacterium endocarditidis]POY42188.1 DNA gyrase inhibitor YacG [Avibacterium endocarditidis]
MGEEIFTVPCPHCQKSVPWTPQSQYRPFCSKRCQLIDLGEWANEEKAIPCETADFATNEHFGEDWRG